MSSAPPMRTKRAPPKLPASAFSLPPPQQKRTSPLSVIDTHVHLWTNEQLRNGNAMWQKDASVCDQLKQEHSLEHYAEAVKGIKRVGGGETRFEGAVFVQAEAQHDDEDSDGSKGGWDGAIDEIDYVCKAALASDIKILALVPWAPVHQGPTALASFFERLDALPSLASLTAQSSSPNSSLIKSCRYLLQDSPKGFFLTDKFIAGLRWLGEQGIAFDMTVDSVQQEGILEDVIDAVQRVREGQEESKQTRFIIDHFAKPPLVPEPTIPASSLQSDYITSLFSLSLNSGVSLKLSGLLDSASPELVSKAFAEFRSGSSGDSTESLRRRILTFLEPAMESFGEGRIVVGSDWPMFRAKTVSVKRDCAEESAAWAFEMELYRTALLELGLKGEGLDGVFAGNARSFYGL